MGRERGGCGFPSEEELEEERGQAGTGARRKSVRK